jgi:hypothetical protein
MPQGAHVTSVEDIEAFRSGLVLYLSKARPALEEVSAEVVRTRLWLQNDQRLYWENQVRRRTKELEQAQQALFSSGIASMHGGNDAERMAVQRARRNLEEAEAKLKRVKHWSREFDGHTDPLTRQLDSLHTLLSNDMLKATAFLTEALKALDAYADIAPPSIDGAVLPPTAPPQTGEPAEPAAGGAEAAQEGPA